ncbi:N-acetyltransferase family protein [Microbacterium oryzae]|uniref:GNAT family N-acetyltransferase n=1 Tax=Microbacterium oryzae TaxID=743009 RepID=UPI0025B1927D|nr:GNAT family N-acetyltransferase [Microbacterium oryzae]MDN3309342.1 N-acetyltransferase family protein [Microbacterium oryzae]
MSAIEVRPFRPADWSAVEEIYRHGIATGHATFEEHPPTWEEFDRGKIPGLRFVADIEGRLAGWVAASPVSSRAAYRGVIEHSVYIHPAAQGQGVARVLLAEFLEASDAAGFWMVQSSIFPENTVSIALHERAGFRRVGVRERIALMTYGPLAGTWRDTVLFERRRPAE